VLKEHPAASQGDHLDRVHSVQMVLEMIRRGNWSGRVEAQRRLKVSKLRAKGLFDYHSSETVVKAARWGPVGQIKGYSYEMFTLKGRAEKQLFA
jgi:hypothetical protein